MADIVNDPERVTSPLRGDRRGNFEEVTWDEALDDIADRLRRIIAEHGPDAVAYYSGNPAGFGMAGAHGSKEIHRSHRLDRLVQRSPTGHVVTLAGGMPLPVRQHTRHRDPRCGSHRVHALLRRQSTRHSRVAAFGRTDSSTPERDRRPRRARCVVVDPARTKTAQAFEHIGIHAGGDVWLLAGLIHVIFSEGLESEQLNATTTGLEALQSAVAP